MDNLRATARAVRLSAERRRGPALRAMLCLGAAAVHRVPDRAPRRRRPGFLRRLGRAVRAGLALPIPGPGHRRRRRRPPLAVFLGAVTGSRGWIAALTAGTFAAAASFICQTVELSPPREMMFVMALLAAIAVPGDTSQALHRAVLTAAGGVLAWLISMAPAILHRDRPETSTITAHFTRR